MNNLPDDILIKALELQEQGKPLADIYAQFPHVRAELEHYFALTDDLRAAATAIVPSRTLLQNTLNRARAERAMPSVAHASFWTRLPFGVRLAAPALAVVLLLFVVDRFEVLAPSPNSPVPGLQPATEGTTGASPAVNQGAGTNSAGSAGTSAPAPMSAAFAVPAAAPAPQSPDAAADQATDAFVNDANSEQNNLSDTSGAQQAAQADDSQSAQDVASPTQ